MHPGDGCRIRIECHIDKAKLVPAHSEPYNMFIFRLVACLSCSVIVHGASVVQPNSILTPSDEKFWQSSTTDFTFGFLPTGKDGLYVLGVSFRDKTLVWTAGANGNGGFKVNDKSSLHFKADGNLVLLDERESLLWQSNTGNEGTVSATMQDDGNFVVRNDRNVIVWDTFSNPTDTLLVDQALRPGKTLRLDSYSLSLQPSGNFTLKWNNTIIYWTVSQPQSTANANATASLDDQGRFTVSNSSGGHLWTATSSDYTDVTITVRRIKLDPDGNLRSYGWENSTGLWQVGWTAVEDQCQVYGWCGNFGMCSYNGTVPICMCPTADFVAVDSKNPTEGCKRKQDIAMCTNNQSMAELENTEFLSYPPESLSDVFNAGTSACEQNCLKNPSCVASTAVNDGSGTCHIKIANFLSVYQSPTIQSISYIKVCGSGSFLRPPPPPPPTNVTSGKVSVVGIAVAVIGTAVALIIIETGLWWVCCGNNPRFRRLSAEYTLLEYASGAPVQFSYNELKQSTRGFRERVGSGGFGAVYKGTLPNRAVVAVKRLEGIEQGEKQFRMEVAIIGSTHHLNLARLIGFCSEGRHRLLVYEYMKNASLDTFLFASGEQGGMLDWDRRFNIALGTARGIAYLHEECRDCIVHCDIKPENILLDENFNAKVSDFGLAKLINSRGHRNRLLGSVRGTRGYLAPEWRANLPVTSKSDVFSYGMVLLEIVSGRRNFDTATSGRKKFSTWAFEEFERGNIMNIVDEKLGGHANLDQVERAIRICFWCIQQQPSQRPSMGKVVQMLEGVLPIEKPPAPKSFEGLQSSASSSQSTMVTAASAPAVSSFSSLSAI